MRWYSENSIVKVWVLAAGLLLALPSRAQSTSCPLQPVQVKDVGSQIVIDFGNVSGKTVSGYTFDLTFFDHAGKAHKFPQSIGDSIQLSSHHRRTAVRQTQLASHFLFPYAQAFLQQVTFADGTTWVDDGSHQCSTISVQE